MGHTEAAIQALRDSGIRAIFGYGTPGTLVWEWFYESKLKHPLEAKTIRKTLLPSDDELVTMALAIRGPEYSTMEVTKHDIRLGRELGLQISMHIGGGTFGPRYNGVQKLYEAGLLEPDLNFAHANTISENDFRLLADHNCTISVTPEVELQMGLGLPVTGKAIQNGIKCGLGVDVVTATSGNMFDQMKVALQTERAIQNKILYQKGEMPEKLTITDSDILKMATSGGAETLGLSHKTGTLEVGKQADIILIDTHNISLSPSLNPVSSVVLYAKENHVDTVMVAGKILKRHGKLVYPDLQELLEKAKKSASRILNKKVVEAIN
jgi:cytosine/adenosine deaminase-related metal-dependent hydrolase